jgi:uncharacterized protein YoxC
MSEQIIEKLNKMHTDIKLTNERLQHVVGNVHDHEIILRGENKMNGLVGDVRNMKTSQTTAHKLWLMMVGTASAIIGWIGLK